MRVLVALLFAAFAAFGPEPQAAGWPQTVAARSLSSAACGFLLAPSAGEDEEDDEEADQEENGRALLLPYRAGEESGRSLYLLLPYRPDLDPEARPSEERVFCI